MRIFILLLLALGLSVLFAMFPNVADETLSIHAFGWVFETRQGPFILVLILALGAFWLLRRIVLALLAGPGQLWHVLKTGRRKRREAYLREGLADWVDMRGDRGARSFRKGRGFLPAWADDLLARLPMSPTDVPSPAEGEEPLLVALSARMASDPHGSPRPDPGERLAHLNAWLKAHPAAPLAQERMAALLQETGDWKGLVSLLEDTWKRGGNSASRAAPRLAAAYMQLAAASTEEADLQERIGYLRKAHRLQPGMPGVVLSLGRAMLAAGEGEACRKLWLDHVERHNDVEIAAELAPLYGDDAMKAYRKTERRHAADLTPAMAMLRASLAHTAGLSGIASEQMDRLLASSPSPQAWRILGGWREQAGDWRGAAEAYRQALALTTPGATST